MKPHTFLWFCWLKKYLWKSAFFVHQSNDIHGLLSQYVENMLIVHECNMLPLYIFFVVFLLKGHTRKQFRTFFPVANASVVAINKFLSINYLLALHWSKHVTWPKWNGEYQRLSFCDILRGPAVWKQMSAHLTVKQALSGLKALVLILIGL